MNIFEYRGNRSAQYLQIVHYATTYGYTPHPLYATTPRNLKSEAQLATDWLNDTQCRGDNYYGYENNHWGVYPLLPTR